MISVEEAKKLVLNQKIIHKTEKRLVENCLGFVLAEDVISRMNMPPFAQSAMDGYAICGNHSSYQLIDEIKAGDNKEISLNNGEACRVFTGGAVPKNSTAVIMQEKVNRVNNTISIDDEIIENKNIRPIGEQLKIGDLIFEKGVELSPAHLGMLHTLGIDKVEVYKNPDISILTTGNELVKAGNKIEFGQIYESNSITLKSACESKNYKVQEISSVEDNYEKTLSKINDLLSKNDVLLISGGISVGDYDFVGKVLSELGVEQVFYKVKQKPGKPLFFGKKEYKFVFALPGNPAAALTCFYIYVLPLLNKLSNQKTVELPQKYIPIADNYNRKGDRQEFLKAKIIDNQVEILDKQASSMLWSFAEADAIAFATKSYKKGEKILVYKID